MTRILAPTRENIAEAARSIRAGEVVGFPTETVYGLGANALDDGAVRKIFVAKGRPGDNPLIVHVASMDAIPALIEGGLPDAARKLAEAYWPGPMTLICKKSAIIPDSVTAGLGTVGIRFPSHPVARALIEEANVPIAAPSANLSGRPSPTTAKHVYEDMAGRIEWILDGGACAVGLESTVIDATVLPVRVLRPGGVTVEMIEAVLGEAVVDASVLRPLKPGEIARSPGMKYKHYAPKGQVTIVSGDGARETIMRLYDEAVVHGDTCRILALDAHAYGERAVLSLGNDERDAANRLFDALRALDEQGVTHAFAEAVSTQGVGLAVMNRMVRAAAFDIVFSEQQ